MSSTFETVAGHHFRDRRHPARDRSRRRATPSTISASIRSPSSTSPSPSTRPSASSCRSSSGRRRSTRARSRPRSISCSKNLVARIDALVAAKSAPERRLRCIRPVRPRRPRTGRDASARYVQRMRLEYFEMIDRVVAFDRAAEAHRGALDRARGEPGLRGPFPGPPAGAGRAPDRDHGAGLRLSRARPHGLHAHAVPDGGRQGALPHLRRARAPSSTSRPSSSTRARATR